MRKAELSGHLSLIETSLFARRDELLKDRIVLSLERSRPRFPRSSSFRRPRLAHGSSFDNGLPNPLIRDKLEQELGRSGPIFRMSRSSRQNDPDFTCLSEPR